MKQNLFILSTLLLSSGLAFAQSSYWCKVLPWTCSETPSEPKLPQEPENDLPDFVEVSSMVANGTGCPQGDLIEFEKLNKNRFRIRYSDLIAEGGEDISLREARKNCQLTISLSYPEGWTYGIESVLSKGYVDLDEDLTAQVRINTYFQGGEQNQVGEISFDGPKNKGFNKTFKVESIDYAPCTQSRSLNLNSATKVSGRSNYGTMNVNETVVRLKWKTCD